MAISASVAKARLLCAGLSNDAWKAKVIIDFVSGSMLYDHMKARTVANGYVPDPDATLSSMNGICFDFAALVMVMLRSQGVPCDLIVGWADGQYHAWNEAMLDGVPVCYDVTSRITGVRYVEYKAERTYELPHTTEVTASMTAKEKRSLVISRAKPALGRNRYSQDAKKRECAFSPYVDGRYYSDCSSFVRWLYRLLCLAIAIADFLNIGSNTAAIIRNKKLRRIECKIKNGVPTDVSALRVADMFMFRGNDPSRPESVGHIEIVSKISGNSVTLMGHGSGSPKTHGMKSYCTMRWLWKERKTGNRGLICVLRAIEDDPGETYDRLRVTGGSVNIRTGPGLTKKIIGKVSKDATLVRNFKDTDGWYGIVYGDTAAYISKKYAEAVSPK